MLFVDLVTAFSKSSSMFNANSHALVFHCERDRQAKQALNLKTKLLNPDFSQISRSDDNFPLFTRLILA